MVGGLGRGENKSSGIRLQRKIGQGGNGMGGRASFPGSGGSTPAFELLGPHRIEPFPRPDDENAVVLPFG